MKNDDIGFTMTPEMRRFEAAMQLKDLKAGDLVTKQHMGAIEHFLGPILEAARKVPMTEIRIERNAEGKLVETSNTGLIASIEETEVPYICSPEEA